MNLIIRKSSSDVSVLKVLLAVRLSKAKCSVAVVDSHALFALSPVILSQASSNLFIPNAAVRYLLPPVLVQPQVNALFEYEESVLTKAIQSSDDISPVLSNINDKLKDLDSPAVDCILFANLYSLLSTNESKTKYKGFTTLYKWFEKTQKNAIVISTLLEWKNLVLVIQNLYFEPVFSGDNYNSDSNNTSNQSTANDSFIESAKVKPDVLRNLDHHSRKILPIPGQRNILITSALPYVNNYPHLGNIIGAVLSADVYARYCRLQGHNALYVCGSDEYGTATETKALAEGISCQALCDKFNKLHSEVYEWFNIDFDIFGRTSTEAQTKIAQDIYIKCRDNGFTKEDEVTQLYCETHNSFLADRYVTGTCPKCGYDDANGDQCDKCGNLLDAIELLNPKCSLDKATPVVRNSNHVFLDLAHLQPKCEKFVKESSIKGKWSSNTIGITNSWLKEGLKPRCITRDLKWGTKVPGMPDKVFYVWFDAPIGYPSITASYTPEWEKWWKNPKEVQLYQFMGKDNVAFHTVIFPSTLLATGEDWTLVHHLNTTEYLQYEGKKFSKSKNVGVFGHNAKLTGIPSDVWRYYLISNRPESSDSQFSWDSFLLANNSELLANFGNFVNRLMKFLNSKYHSTIPAPSTKNDTDKKFITDINALLKDYHQQLEDVKLRAGLRLVMDISARGNLYLQDNKLDNSLLESSKERCDSVVYHGFNLVYLLSALVYPFLPVTCGLILKQLQLPTRKLESWGKNGFVWECDDILSGHKTGKAEYLFKLIEEAKIEEFRVKFGGGADESAAVEEPGKKKKGGKAKKGAVIQNIEITQGEKSPEVIEMEKVIADQGLVVRKLKMDKANAADIKSAVDELLSLKKKLNELLIKK